MKGIVLTMVANLILCAVHVHFGSYSWAVFSGGISLFAMMVIAKEI